MLDSLGHVIPQSTMHHMELLNFDRRQLVYTMAERVIGIGEETQPTIIPKSVGMPLNRGSHMGLYIMWNNETSSDMNGIYLQLKMPWAPSTMTPSPLKVLPFKVDVNMHPGRGDAFDFPEGSGSKATEFTVPIAGRLIAIGGHMHDFGKELRIEDVATGKVIARVPANRRPDGTVSSVAHRLFGILGSRPASRPRAHVPHGRRVRRSPRASRSLARWGSSGASSRRTTCASGPRSTTRTMIICSTLATGPHRTGGTCRRCRIEADPEATA